VPAVDGSQTNNRPPRGALIVVAIGLIATVAAAALANENLAGEAAQVEWVQFEEMPDSKAVPVPGGKGEMQLTNAGLRSTGTNVSGYSLVRSAAKLNVSAGAPIGGARIHCSMRSPGSEVAQTPDLRATYPRSSEESVADQAIPEVVLVEFASHGTGLATVDVEDLDRPFATAPGIKVEWPTFHDGIERWKWYLPPGPPTEDLELPFYVVWRATKPPMTDVECEVETSAGTATVTTSGAMDRVGEPIDEEEDA
jgi:hypothetical protein